MSDVVVTMPKAFQFDGLRGLAAWIAEGDAAGDPKTQETYEFCCGNRRPKIEPGERVYVVYDRHLIGYATLIELDVDADSRVYLVRGGDAQAVTIDDEILGFRGYRYRWWDRASERPFPEWRELANQPKSEHARDYRKSSRFKDADYYHALLCELHDCCQADGFVFAEEMLVLVRTWLRRRYQTRGEPFIELENFEPDSGTPAAAIEEAYMNTTGASKAEVTPL